MEIVWLFCSAKSYERIQLLVSKVPSCLVEHYSMALGIDRAIDLIILIVHQSVDDMLWMCSLLLQLGEIVPS
jgi:hypothetical protein